VEALGYQAGQAEGNGDYRPKKYTKIGRPDAIDVRSYCAQIFLQLFDIALNEFDGSFKFCQANFHSAIFFPSGAAVKRIARA
jgi:hypothetical protein